MLNKGKSVVHVNRYKMIYECILIMILLNNKYIH